jgi:hypothetical protein
LRQGWPDLKGTKAEICFAAAETRDSQRICKFVDEQFTCCKQHVYTFLREPDVTAVPATLQDESAALEYAGTHSLFILRATYSVVLRDPLQEASIDFLWPIRLEITPDRTFYPNDDLRSSRQHRSAKLLRVRTAFGRGAMNMSPSRV